MTPYNEGNTCYLNTLMYCLSSLNKFVNSCGEYEFKSILLSFQNNQMPQISPSEYVKNCINDISVHNQQDVHELYMKIMEYLSTYISNYTYRPSDIFTEGGITPLQYDMLREKLENHSIKPFEGVIYQTINCQSCRYISWNTFPFIEITLYVPTNDNTPIFDIMDQTPYCGYQDINNYHCSNCNKYTLSKRLDNIYILPDIIIFHLIRYDKDGLFYRNRVDLLNLNNVYEINLYPALLYEGKGRKPDSSNYRLKSISVFRNTDHYIAVRFDDNGNHTVNDDLGRENDLRIEEIERNATMLFYERV